MKKQVKQLRDDMDTRTIVEKMSALNGFDFGTTWKETDEPHKSNETSVMAGQTLHSSQVFGRGLEDSKMVAAGPGPNFGTRLERDFQNAPLMTDGGMFLDSRFNELESARRVD